MKFEQPPTISTASIDSGAIADGVPMLDTADSPLKERVRPLHEEAETDCDLLLAFKNVTRLVQNDRRVLPLREARLLRIMRTTSENFALHLDHGDAILALPDGFEALSELTWQRLPLIPPLLVGDQPSPDDDVVVDDGLDDVVTCAVLEATFLQQLMIFAFSCSPDKLHQHLVSVFLLVIISLLFPTQRRISRISLITFIVFGDQFRDLQVLLKRFKSIEFWCAITFFRNNDDFDSEKLSNKCVSMSTLTSSSTSSMLPTFWL